MILRCAWRVVHNLIWRSCFFLFCFIYCYCVIILSISNLHIYTYSDGFSSLSRCRFIENCRFRFMVDRCWWCFQCCCQCIVYSEQKYIYQRKIQLTKTESIKTWKRRKKRIFSQNASMLVAAWERRKKTMSFFSLLLKIMEEMQMYCNMKQSEANVTSIFKSSCTVF